MDVDLCQWHCKSYDECDELCEVDYALAKRMNDPIYTRVSVDASKGECDSDSKGAKQA